MDWPNSSRRSPLINVRAATLPEHTERYLRAIILKISTADAVLRPLPQGTRRCGGEVLRDFFCASIILVPCCLPF
jgi:hypothetical protein